MLIVESLVDKKRFPAYGNEKIISLGDIAMYTDTEEVPLKDVLLSMKKKENGAAVALDVKKASVKELQVWYNLLVASGITDFEATETPETATEEVKEKVVE